MSEKNPTTPIHEPEATTSRCLAEVLASAAQRLDAARLEASDLAIDAIHDPDALVAVVRVLRLVRDAAHDVAEARDYAGHGGEVLS